MSKTATTLAIASIVVIVSAAACGSDPSTEPLSTSQEGQQGTDAVGVPSDETTLPPPPMPEDAVIVEVDEPITWRDGDIRLEPNDSKTDDAVRANDAYLAGARIAGRNAVQDARYPVRIMHGLFTDASYGRSADGSTGPLYEDVPAWLVVVPGVLVPPSGPPGGKTEPQLSDVMVVIDATTNDELLSYVEPHDDARFGKA